MSTIQIVGHLVAAERAEFDTYAREVGLDVAGLLALLWSRELRVGRLRDLGIRHPEPDQALDDKAVAHLRSDEDKARIVGHARAHGMSTSRACATLVRAELGERWLEEAM